MSVRFGGKLDSYQTLRLLEERLGIGLFVWNVRTDELQWSDGMYALFGLKPGSVRPSLELVLSLTHPEDRIAAGCLRQEIRDGRLIDHDYRAVLHDGRVRHINQRAWITADGHSEKLVAGVCVDVSSTFAARAQSELVQRRFGALIDAANCIVWMTPPEPHSLEPVNLLSAERLQLKGSWFDNVPDSDKTQLLSNWSKAVRQQQPFTSLHRISLVDGSVRWYQSHAVPLRDRDLSIIEWIGVTVDVHDLVAGGTAACKITGAQIRGGRGILNWSVRDLAIETGLTAGIIRRLEEFDGYPTGQDEALAVVLRVMESAGIEFLALASGKPAVRPR